MTCTPTNHRCIALPLWFFALLNGDADGLALARAAVNECEANPNPGALTGPIPIEGT